jgi:putative GTP pyrophosphokinase
MSENLFGLTVAADKGLDDLQCQRLLAKIAGIRMSCCNTAAHLKALESRLEIF